MGNDRGRRRPIGVPDPERSDGPPATDTNDAGLLAGDELRRELHRELPSLLRTATLYLGDPAAAEELTRRTLQECVGPTHQLSRGGMRLTLHLWLRALAVSDRGPRPGPVPQSRANPVEAALERLPADVRAAVHLVDTEGFSYHETARILGVPASTATALIHAGRDLVEAVVWRGGDLSRDEA